MSMEIQQEMTAGAQQIKIHLMPETFELVRIPAGEFQLGSSAEEDGHESTEEPVRHITISKPFYLGRYEITQAQYKFVMGVNPSEFEGDSLAVDQVTYSEAIEFCRKLSQLTGLTVRLPTEVQWEYACRAGTRTRFYSGNTLSDLDRVAWYRENSGEKVHIIGQKEPNAWGLYDMHGNVAELCQDSLPAYDLISETDPIGMMHDRKGAMRGGGWMHPWEYLRSASRLMSSDRFGGAGIRIAIDPKE